MHHLSGNNRRNSHPGESSAAAMLEAATAAFVEAIGKIPQPKGELKHPRFLSHPTPATSLPVYPNL